MDHVNVAPVTSAASFPSRVPTLTGVDQWVQVAAPGLCVSGELTFKPVRAVNMRIRVAGQ